MTEEEAKKKLCPILTTLRHAQYSIHAPTVTTTMGVGEAHCIASRCMAWRTAAPEYAEKEPAWPPDAVVPFPWDVGVTGFYIAAKRRMELEGWSPIGQPILAGCTLMWGRGEIPTGFCGLAGKE
jgi:hypothetical protein